jgi:uncharacterized protein YcbK (DUF882 family)
MQLSENFSLNELTKSQTATRKGIDNKPTSEQVENLKALSINILQKIRNHYERPVRVTSGYRSPELCVSIGSSVKSQHAKGEAADFEITGIDNFDIHIAKSKLSIPVISKSAASPLACCDFTLEPIDTHSSGLL